MLTRTALTTAFVLSVSVLASAQVRVITTIPAGVMTVSDWYRQSVYDPMDKKIGTINDVLITKDGKVEVLVIGVGGFVGVGTKNVAVPPASVSMTTKNNKNYLVMNTTKDELKAAPGFKFDRTSRTWMPADGNPPPNKKK